MKSNRLEAFSDGVIAIIITIMVLELKVPHGDSWAELQKTLPIFISYVLSFIYVGIYWNNHHHLMNMVETINGKILWANLHLLFWLSIIPFASAYSGENHFAAKPMALYGFVLLMCGVAYFILQSCIIKHQGKDSILKKAIGSDFKGKISMVLYPIAIISSFYSLIIPGIIYIGVALYWTIPDKRIERFYKIEEE